MKVLYQPRLDYLQPGCWQSTLENRLELIEQTEAVTPKFPQRTAGRLADHYNAVGRYLYAMGNPIAEVRQALANAAQAYLRVFELRGTQEPFPVTLVTVDPTKDPDDPARVLDRRQKDPPGTMDHSVTNSREALLGIHVSLAAGQFSVANQLAGMIWDPADADWLGQNSSICTFNDHHLAHAVKNLFAGDLAGVECELAQVNIKKKSELPLRFQREMVRALAKRAPDSFRATLDQLLAWHRKQAKKQSEYCLSFPAIGFSAWAVAHGIVSRSILPEGDVYLPLELIPEGPLDASGKATYPTPHDQPRVDDDRPARLAEVLERIRDIESDRETSSGWSRSAMAKWRILQVGQGTLSRSYEALGLLYWSLGYPIAEVRQAFVKAAESYLRIFELRGASQPMPAPLIRCVPPRRPSARFTGKLEAFPVGTKDFSLTDAKEGFRAVMVALAAGEFTQAGRIALIPWDTPGEGWPNSNPNEEHLGYALQKLIVNDRAGVEAELKQIVIEGNAGASLDHQREMIRALADRSAERFLAALARMLAWHDEQARIPDNQYEREFALCLPAVGLSAWAVARGIVPRNMLLADNKYSPLELVPNGPSDVRD